MAWDEGRPMLKSAGIMLPKHLHTPVSGIVRQVP